MTRFNFPKGKFPASKPPVADHVEVFYIGPAVGWALAEFDAKGHQISDAVFAFHRKRLVDRAAREIGLPIRVYNKDGLTFREVLP